MKNNTYLLFVLNMKNNLRSKSLTISLISISFFIVAAFVFLGGVIFLKPMLEGGYVNRDILTNYFTLILFLANIVGIGTALNVFTAQPLIKEKKQGIVQSLMVTPLKINEIWIARSLAVYIPGVVYGFILTLISFFFVNFIFIVPNVGFLISPWLIVNSFIAMPMVYFFLSLLVHLVGFINNPISGNVIAQIFLPVYTPLVLNLGFRNVFNSASWFFFIINIGIAIVFGILILIIKGRFTKEQIILSSRS